MKEENISFIEGVTWEDVREKITDNCQELGKIIDDISPKKEYPLFYVRYPFGARIIEKALFHLPDESGFSIPISDIKIPQKIREQLNYSSLPLGIIIKNNVELFNEIDGKVFCGGFYGKDLDIGVLEYFGWTTPYSITSGARSLYMLPKVSETISHKRLKNEFGISVPPPKRLFDHCHIFKQIANSSNFSKKWYCELIILSNKWVDKIKNDPAWHKLNTYLWKKGWEHCKYARKKSILDIILKEFVQNLNMNNLKFDHYVIDTLRHLLMVGVGALPGSAPSVNREEAGPIKEIQMIYEDIYNLQNIPTIMQPKYFCPSENSPVYYSLQNPTLLEVIPKSKKATSIIETVRDLKDLIDCFSEKMPCSMIEQFTQPFCKTINKLQFDFFHSDTFAYGPYIRPSIEMPKDDLALIYDPTKKPIRKFADNSPFLKGCIRISNKFCL